MRYRAPAHPVALTAALVAAALALALPGRAMAVEVPPSSNYFFQTNGPASAIGNGDWYTSTAAGGGAGYHYLQITVPCDWPSTEPIHLDLFSPEMNHVSGALAQNEEPLGAYDSSEFELYGPGVTQGPAADQPGRGTGIAGSKVVYQPAGAGVAEAWTRYFTIAAPVACGNYLLRSAVLAAGQDPFNPSAEGNDQNGWKVRVGRDGDSNPGNAPPANASDFDGVPGTNDEISIGFLQSTFQHNDAGTPCQTMYESVPPSASSITFHNFDFDGASTANRIRYYSPNQTVDPTASSGGTVGTLSGSTTWNGSSGTARVGDTIANPAAGVWAIVFCVNSGNQFIQEAQVGAPSSYTLPTNPVMQVTKSDGRTAAYRGETLTYAVHATNAASGSSAGSGNDVRVVDTLPSNATFVSCQVKAPHSGTCSASGATATAVLTGALDAGDSFDVEYVVTVSSNATGSVANNVKVSSRNAAGEAMPEPTASDSDSVQTAIGDLVFEDSDGDGVRDAGEPGMGGVGVVLRSSGGAQLATTTTAADGSYAFLNQTAGSYQVDLTLPVGYGLTAGVDPAPVTLPAGAQATVLTADFGLRPSTASIGDLVWDDQNGDGAKGGGEPGLAGVTVRLLAADGTTPVATQVTAAGGAYSFGSLFAGSYVVRVDDPAGWTLTGGADPVSVTLAEAEARANVDFGFRRADASVAGRVFDDADANGARAAGEAGHAAVTVRLFAADGTTQLATTVSAGDGTWSFPGLYAGTYVVKIDAPAATTITSTHPRTVTPAAGQAVTGVDIGLAADAQVTVRLDATPDAAQDFAYTATGLGLGSFGLDDDADATLPAERTFTITSFGAKSVAHGAQAGWTLTGVVCTGDAEAVTDTAARTAALDVDPGEQVVCTFSARQRGRVEIEQQTLPGGAAGAFDFSGDAGSFSLADDGVRGVDVEPGTFMVTQAARAGFDLTGLSCDDGSMASLANRRASIDVGPGETVRCVYTDTKRASVAGRQFEDLDADGVRDAGEPDVADFTVYADLDGDGELDSGEPTATTATDGSWELTGLVPGAYQLRQAERAGWTCSHPAPCSRAVTLGPGEDATGADFGAWRPADPPPDPDPVPDPPDPDPDPPAPDPDPPAPDPDPPLDPPAPTPEPDPQLDPVPEPEAPVGHRPPTIGTPTLTPTPPPGEATPPPLGRERDPKTDREIYLVPRTGPCVPLELDVPIADAGDVTGVRVVFTPLEGEAREITLTDAPPEPADGVWSGTLDCAADGELELVVTVPEGELRSPVGDVVLLDPSGIVYDEQLYAEQTAGGATPDQARCVSALAGATVTLQRRTARQWRKVAAADPGLRPGVNPQTTAEDGSYRWDASDGVYRVVVLLDGYVTTHSRAVTVPPPVLDLHVALRRQPGTAAPDPRVCGEAAGKPQIEVKSGCLQRPVYAWVKGRRVRRVVFYLDGAPIRTVSRADARGRFGIRVDRRGLDDRRHDLRARVVFVRAARKRPVMLRMAIRRCVANPAPALVTASPGPGCGARPFTAWVRGDRIRRVVFSLDGRRLGAVDVGDWKRRYLMRIDPRELAAGPHRVSARVEFVPGAGMSARTVQLDFRKCR